MKPTKTNMAGKRKKRQLPEPHGNSHENQEDFHLYEIRDRVDESIFKYGISKDQLRPDGSSPRASEQVDFLNLAVRWLRYYAKVLIEKIAGRLKAEETEEQHITEYELKYGERPRGNRKR
jgi:URI fold toxin 2